MLSLINPNQIYQTKIEVSNFATGFEQFESIYICLNFYPLYQIKYYEMLGFFISPEIQSHDYFSDLNKLEKVSNIKSHKNLPNFDEIQLENLQTIKDLYNDKQLLNYNYIQGKFYEKEGNFAKAFAFFEEGLKFKEQLSMLEIFKILIEPNTAQNFLIKPDYKRAITILLENFIENGLFDNVSKHKETIFGIHLLYIYLDCFEDFRNLVSMEAKESPLLEFLILPSLQEAKVLIPQIMKNIEVSIIQKKDLILGDLYHSYFLGISNELEFNIRQFHYQSAIKQGNWHACARTGWINQIYLEIFLRKLDAIELKQSLESEKNQELEEKKVATLDFINKTKKNYYSSFSILKKKSQFKYSEEFLRFLLENNDNLLPKDKNDKNNSLHYFRLLRSLGCEDVTSDLFSLLKIKRKLDGKSDIIINEMKTIAVKLKGKSNIELCYCMEKGLGFDKIIPKIFQFYHDEIFLFFDEFPKLVYCLYRVGKILEKHDKMKEYAIIFFEICLLKITNSLKTQLSYQNLFYLAKIYNRKSYLNDSNYSNSLLYFLQEKLANKQHLDFPQKLLLLQINQKVKIQQNPDQTKISLQQILEKESKFCEEKLRKSACYEPFMKEDLASYINQTFRGLVIKFDERMQLERALSPNLRYKNLNNEPEFSPFIFKKLKKLENISHFFGEDDLEFIAPFTQENEQLFSGVIKKNSQKIVLKEFRFRMDEIDRIIDFLNRLEFYLKISSKFVLNIVGIAYHGNIDKTLTVFICFEWFEEFFLVFLKNNLGKYDTMIEFGKVLTNLFNLQNNGLSCLGFTIENFVYVNDKQSFLFADLELNLLYKDPIAFVDLSNQEKILATLQCQAPPELFKAFTSKTEKINMATSSLWSLACLFILLCTKLKPLMPKELMFPLEAQAFEKIEIGIKEILNNDLTLKQYNEILNKCIILERTVDLKNIITQFNLFETIIKPFQIKDDKIPIFSFKKSHFLGSLPAKALIYLSRKGLYEGEILDEVPHGTGTFTMKSVSYEGKFEKGALEGYGRYRSEIWDIMYDGKFSENIARHGVMHLIQSATSTKAKESLFENHSYTEFEKDYYLPSLETINKMLDGFDTSLGVLSYSPENFLPKIKEYKTFFDVFLKNKDKYSGMMDCRANLFYYSEGFKEFVVRKCEMVENFVIIYNESISKQEIFFFDQICLGLFQLEKPLKTLSNFSSFLFEAPLPGCLFSYFGKKIAGSFLDFKPLFGYKFNNFLNYTSFNNLKLIYQGTLKLINPHKRDYNGSIINEKANGYGEETFNDNYIYKGFYQANEPFGKGVLQEKSGKALIKGFFQKGLPLWGTYHKDREVKYKGNFIFHKEGTLFSFKSIKEMIDAMTIKGFLLKNDEKIFAQYGTFEHLDEETTSGLSKIEYKNGIVFEGNLEKSLRKGRGTLTIKKALNDFIIAYGEWDNMKLKGIIKWDKANEYEKSSGCFSFTEGNNPTMDFYGQISFRNGSNYWGGFKENKLHGFGQLDLKSNDNKIKQYLGEFEEAKKSGFGVLKENDLDPITYKGRFKNNKKSGYGIVYRKDEKSLEGLFEDGIFKSGWMYINDKVIEKIESNFFEYNETKDLYSPKGFGTIFLKDGNRLECSLDNAIEDISEKKFKRIGILITETSSFYEGLIDMFKVQSHGTYRNGLMTLYEGEFKYGLFQGYGKIYDKKGRMYQGYFEKGMKLGFGREVDENEENVFSGYWKNGLRDGYGKIARAIEEKKDEIFVLCQGLKIIKIIKM